MNPNDEPPTSTDGHTTGAHEPASVADIAVKKPQVVVKRDRKPSGSPPPAAAAGKSFWSTAGPYVAAVVTAALALGVALWRMEKRFTDYDQAMRVELTGLQESIARLEEESAADFQQFGAELEGVNEKLYKHFDAITSQHKSQIDALRGRVSRLTGRADTSEEGIAALTSFNQAEDAPWKVNAGDISRLQGDVGHLNAFNQATNAPWRENAGDIARLRATVQTLASFKDDPDSPWKVNAKDIERLSRIVDRLQNPAASSPTE